MSNGVRPQEVVLLCDEPADRDLFLTIRRVHPLLAAIPAANVRTYDQAREGPSGTPLDAAVAPLHQDDRPDWIFCRGDVPILVTELTKHAYTGDHGLQRFARFAAAAENGVPFIYFGPLARVRDDELDDEGRTASPRRLTSHLFEGMEKLAQVYGTPQLYVQWAVDNAGLPASLPFSPTDEQILELYGPLLDRIALLLFSAPLRAGALAYPKVALAQEETSAYAAEKNTRDSDVLFEVAAADLSRLLLAPSTMLGWMSDSRYFAKGKPDKLLAAYALTLSKIRYVQLPDGTVRAVSAEEHRQLVTRILANPKFTKKSIVFFTGYKWRSDPHGGVVVNLDYRLCRAPGQVSPQQRGRGLVVVYPRVSLSGKDGTGSMLKALSFDSPSGLRKLFNERYGSAAGEKMAACLKSDGLFGVWRNTTKQARLFRRYADIVILNDGLVLGQSLDRWV